MALTNDQLEALRGILLGFRTRRMARDDVRRELAVTYRSLWSDVEVVLLREFPEFSSLPQQGERRGGISDEEYENKGSSYFPGSHWLKD